MRPGKIAISVKPNDDAIFDQFLLDYPQDSYKSQSKSADGSIELITIVVSLTTLTINKLPQIIDALNKNKTYYTIKYKGENYELEVKNLTQKGLEKFFKKFNLTPKKDQSHDNL